MRRRKTNPNAKRNANSLPREGVATVQEVSQFLRVSTRTVERMAADQRLPVVRLPGVKSLRFSWAKLWSLIEQ